MFLGEFHHNLDDKGRLTVPARFRDQLVSEGAYVMRGLDQNLMVLPSSTFEKISRRVYQMSVTDSSARLLRRLIFSSADYVEMDKAGRILVAQFLRQAADLENSVIIVGNGEYFEIWSPERWKTQIQAIMEAQMDAEHFSALNLVAGELPVGSD
jgi:MraZ protein